MTVSNETQRFLWPFPSWKADWQEWQGVFQSLIDNIDSTVFASMEAAHLIIKQLPSVRIVEVTPGVEYRLEPAAVTIFISRTHQTEILVSADNLDLEPDSFIVLPMAPGAVGPQETDFELVRNGVDIDPSLIPIGYVRSDYTIYWYNGSYLGIGSPKRLFSFDAGSGGGDTVKVTGADALAEYLDDKLNAGGGISLTVLNPGGTEQLQVAATNAPLSGIVPPHGAVTGNMGQTYYDTVALIHYICDGGNAWSVI